ncbi:MAG: dihydroxyacetone kinase family protein [Monoraphidium minutum]|nr:MAG: dihydroxyacetone kinase family protein [Monoraphidium minutum]
MAPKKALLNTTETLVTDSLDGLLEVVPHLRRLDGFPNVKVVVDENHDRGKVAVICGGGSGHEPSQAAFVGAGMLAAAIAGDVFAAPPAEAVLAAIHAVCGPAGAVMIVTNYTGDRLAFGIAAEQARAAGLEVEVVFVGEDCAHAAPGLAGRRGLAGTALVIKAAGAAAAAGASLGEVASLARDAAASAGTLAVALSECCLPGATPSSRLGPDEMEVGMGAHGEPGLETCKWAPLSELVPRMLGRILGYQPPSGAPIAEGRPPLALLVNGLGGTSNLELFAVAREATAWLRAEGHDLRRLFVGALLTSFSMEGVSLTLMALDPRRLELLDAPTAAPAWPAFRADVSGGPKAPLPLPPATLALRASRAALLAGRPLAGAAAEGRAVEAAVRAAAAALASPEATETLNALDRAAGDGDTGSTCAAAGRALLAVPEGAFAGGARDALLAAAAAVGGAAGGTLGSFCQLALTAAAAALPPTGPAGAGGWAAAAAAACETLSKYGLAQEGSRTMLDALLPAARALAAAAPAGGGGAAAARAAAGAAAEGAEGTKGMAAAVGRASYLRADHLTGADPGAVAVATWLGAVAGALEAGGGAA